MVSESGPDEKLARIRALAEAWYQNYDIIPANDPRNPSEMDQAYDDAGYQLLHILNDETVDYYGRTMGGADGV